MANLLSDFFFFWYADDVALWYELSPGNKLIKQQMTKITNPDLSALKAWGDDNKTTFELDKTFSMVFSQEKCPFDASQLVFEGFPVEQVKDSKVVGYVLDSKLRWGKMIEMLARKAKGRIAALQRVKHLLSSNNLRPVYTMFIRSIMEYGSVAWCGVAVSHLQKLDRIQDRAKRIGGFEVDSLAAKREAAVLSFDLKLMNGDARGVLKQHVPELHEPLRLTKKRTRQVLDGKQLTSRVRTNSLVVYRRGFHGVVPSIWKKVTQEIISVGYNKGWLKIKKRCADWLLGKPSFKPKEKKTKVSMEITEDSGVFIQDLKIGLMFKM